MLIKLLYNCWVLGRAQFKPWGIKKDSVPYMIEVVLTNILVQGGVVYPYVNRLFYGSCLPLVLPSYDAELVIVYGVSSGLRMPMYGWWLLEVFFSSFPPVSCLFPLCTLHRNLVEGIGSCILNHFCCPWGLCLLVSSGFVLWLCYPWSVPVFHTYCMCVLILSAIPLVYGMTICPMVFFVGLLLVVIMGWLLLFVVPLLSLLVQLLLLVLLLSPVCSQLLLITLLCTLLRAQCG